MTEEDKKKPEEDYTAGGEDGEKAEFRFTPRGVDFFLGLNYMAGQLLALGGERLAHPMIGPLDNREDEQFFRMTHEDYRTPEFADIGRVLAHGRMPLTNGEYVPDGLISGARDAEVGDASMPAHSYVPAHSYDFWGLTSRIDWRLEGIEMLDNDPLAHAGVSVRLGDVAQPRDLYGAPNIDDIADEDPEDK
ncbi:hypothetical protein KY359_04560 [Candidatus Woesearchaeota archaeon]|nr:hypothetical protein [Candidatus Woesearchaeota archaeon]